MIRNCRRCGMSMLLADAEIVDGKLKKLYLCYHCGKTMNDPDVPCTPLSS